MKLKPVPGGSRERPTYQLFAGGRRRRGTRIEYFSKEALKARRRDQYQGLRNHVARVLEGMSDSAGKVNKIARRCSHCIPAHLNRQRAFAYLRSLKVADR